MNTSFWPLRFGVGVAFACATWWLPSQVSAYSCATNWVQAPSDGATDVPTNTRLWGFSTGDSTRLVGPSGPVPLEVRYVRIAFDATRATRLITHVPTRELEPNASYTIETKSSGRRGFVTGAGPAQQPPQQPELLSNEARAGDAEFGGYRYRELEFSHGPIIVGDANLALGPLTSISELELMENAREPELLEPASPILRWATSDTRLDVGLGACLVWPDADADQAQARFGAFDLAGNFSGWLVPLTLALPTEPRPCSSSNGSGPSARRSTKRDSSRSTATS